MTRQCQSFLVRDVYRFIGVKAKGSGLWRIGPQPVLSVWTPHLRPF